MTRPTPVRPTECELCVPLENENPSNGIITYLHEPECCNHPDNQEGFDCD